MSYRIDERPRRSSSQPVLDRNASRYVHRSYWNSGVEISVISETDTTVVKTHAFSISVHPAEIVCLVHLSSSFLKLRNDGKNVSPRPTDNLFCGIFAATRE